MYIIDTSIIAARLLRERQPDLIAQEYLKFYDTLDLAECVMTDFIMTESESLLLRSIPKRFKLVGKERDLYETEVNDRFTDFITNSTLDTATPEILYKGYFLFKKCFQSKFISLTDALLITMAEVRSYTILTLDQPMQKIAKDVGVDVYKPA